MILASTATTDPNAWWDQITDAYVDETPFTGSFGDGEGTFTTTGTTEGEDDQ